MLHDPILMATPVPMPRLCVGVTDVYLGQFAGRLIRAARTLAAITGQLTNVWP